MWGLQHPPHPFILLARILQHTVLRIPHFRNARQKETRTETKDRREHAQEALFASQHTTFWRKSQLTLTWHLNHQ